MKKKSLFAGFLALVMCISMMSVTAFAAESTDDAGNTITISTPTQFKDLSDYSNGSGEVRDYPRDFSGWKVVIANDINMTGYTWQPIANFNGDMQGSIKEDGSTTTISYLTVTASEKAGLCANSANGTFSNLTIANSSFTNTNKSSGAYAGAFAANGFTSDFLNCDVKNTTIEGVRFVGGVTGYSYGNITDCDVTDCIVKTNANILGQIAGYGDNIGGIVGILCEGHSTVSNCHVKDTNVSGLRQVGGIAGAVMYGNTVKACSVYGGSVAATGNNRSEGATACAGGIVGQLASQAVGEANAITITGNKVGANVNISGKVAGWAVGDATSRAVSGSIYTISNTFDGENPPLLEIGK